jgi:hypothetical protein
MELAHDMTLYVNDPRTKVYASQEELVFLIMDDT